MKQILHRTISIKLSTLILLTKLITRPSISKHTNGQLMRQRSEDAGRQVEFIVIVDITIIGVFIVVRMIIIVRSRPACLLPPKRSLLPSGFPTKFNSFQSSVYHHPQSKHHPSRYFNTLIINLVIVKCQHPVLRSCCTITITSQSW